MDKQRRFTSNAPTENPYLPPHVTDDRLEWDQRLGEMVCVRERETSDAELNLKAPTVIVMVEVAF